MALQKIAANCPFDFAQQKMWEISWGNQVTNPNATALFNYDSHGGLETINGNPAPAPSFGTNIYVTGPVRDRFVSYEFADGAVNTATIAAGPNACPVIEWEITPDP